MQFYGTAPTHDLTYSDVFLVPSRSNVTSRMDVSLAPEDGTGASIPIVSANMNSVTGPRLAATLARRGGLGVLPQDMHPQDLEAAIEWVKAQHTVFDSPFAMNPDETVEKALTVVPSLPGHGIVLHDDTGKYIGCLAARDLAGALPDARLGELLHGSLPSIDAEDVPDARAAFDLLEAADLLPGELVHIVDVTNGARLETYTIAGERGSGVIGINGAAAHLVHPGDLVILIGYGQMDTAEARTYEPHVVFVDADNKILTTGSDPAEAHEDSGLVRGDVLVHG